MFNGIGVGFPNLHRSGLTACVFLHYSPQKGLERNGRELFSCQTFQWDGWLQLAGSRQYPIVGTSQDHYPIHRIEM
jgi:hypothetical protein